MSCVRPSSRPSSGHFLKNPILIQSPDGRLVTKTVSRRPRRRRQRRQQDADTYDLSPLRANARSTELSRGTLAAENLSKIDFFLKNRI